MKTFLLLLLCLPWTATAAESLLHPGDRIAIIGNTFADQLRREGYLETLLLQRVLDESGHPALSFRNLGWGGDTLSARDRPTNFPTEDTTLTEFGADVLLLSFGLSESFAGEKGIPEFRSGYERLIDHYRAQKYNGKDAPRLILISPIAFEDLGPLTPNAAQRNKDLAAYTKAIQEIAASNDCGFVNLYNPTLGIVSEPGMPQITVNGVHLNAVGYWYVSHDLAEALTSPLQPWSIEIDAKTADAKASGLAIEKISPVSGGLSFTAKESSWPLPPSPSVPDSPDRLTVHNLPPATYTLTIDGEEVATATAAEWSKGIPLDHSPTHREVETYRSQVYDKNASFTFSWKALNQVHIVGERKTSNSGRALPAEVIEFNNLTIQSDTHLRQLPPNNRTRQWRLTATPEQ